MTRSLNSYLAHAEYRDIEAVLAVERFCGFGEYAQERQRRVAEELRREQQQESRR
jgi:hypothetical protein